MRWQDYLPPHKDKPIADYGTISPRAIVIHQTTGDMDDGADAVAYMFSRDDGVRWHWTVGADGTVWKHGEFTDMMAGTKGMNSFSVAIEHDMGVNDDAPEILLERSAQIVAAFCHFIGKKPSRDFIVGHDEDNTNKRQEYDGNDWTVWGGTSTHTDPGDKWPWRHYMDLVEAAYRGETPMTEEQKKKLAEVAAFQAGIEAWMANPDPARVPAESWTAKKRAGFKFAKGAWLQPKPV